MGGMSTPPAVGWRVVAEDLPRGHARVLGTSAGDARGGNGIVSSGLGGTVAHQKDGGQ